MNELSHQAGTSSAGPFSLYKDFIDPLWRVLCHAEAWDGISEASHDRMLGFSLFHVHPSPPAPGTCSVLHRACLSNVAKAQCGTRAVLTAPPQTPVGLAAGCYRACPCKTLVHKIVTQVPRPSPQASITTSPYLPLFLFCPSPSASFAFEVLREPNHSWLCPLWKHRRREGLPVLYRLVAHKSCKGGYKAA